jgi:hypothetical protein
MWLFNHECEGSDRARVIPDEADCRKFGYDYSEHEKDRSNDAQHTGWEILDGFLHGAHQKT